MRTVIAGADVFDAAGRTFQRADVAFADGVIVEVGADLDGDQVIEGAGRQLLPGFIDCHVHVMVSTVDVLRIAQTPYSYRFFEAMHNLSATLRAGITSIRDAGGADLGLRQAVDDGLIAGPHMQIAIGMISQTGGHGDGWLPSGQVLRLLAGSHPGVPDTVVDGPEEMRRVVRELVRAGADVIKVATSGGVLSPRDNPRHAHFRSEELDMLVAEASAAGIAVMAHAQASDGIKNAVRAGIRSIEHGIYLDDEAIELMLRHGTYLVPTLLAPAGVLEAAEQGVQINPESLRKASEVVEAHEESFRRAVEAGVNVAFGTDTGVTPHGQNLRELPLMAKGGMKEEEVLASATVNAADLMGIPAGLVEEGRRADLVLVDGDARRLESVGDAIAGVWKAGVRVV